MSYIPHAQRLAITGEGLKRQRIAVEEAARVDTPFGPLTDIVDLHQEGREPVSVRYICPRALLYTLCELSFAFFETLKAFPLMQDEAQPIHLARIAIYLDDVTPGNVHRPDAGRSYVAIYWTFMDLPSWLLHSVDGWFVLAFVPKRIWRLIPGEQSGLMAALLKVFWPDDGVLSFAGGLLVRHGMHRLVLKAEGVTAWLLDGDAVPKLTLAKTMSAFKCCCKCRNVVARISADRLPAGTLPNSI